MTEPLESGVSLKLEFELPMGRISTFTFANVVYQQTEAFDAGEISPSGIGVTFYGMDPASEFSIGELVESTAANYRP